MQEKNQYARAAQKKSMLGAVTKNLATKGNATNSAIETAKDLLFGAVGGGVAGAALGRASLAVGAIITGIGHYTKSRIASVFGVGMMASSGFHKQETQTMEGTPIGDVEQAQNRVKAFGENLKERLFLDKVLESKKQPSQPPIAGKENVNYFVYPSDELNGAEETTDALDEIERQVVESASEYASEQQVSGTSDEEYQEDDFDLSDTNF